MSCFLPMPVSETLLRLTQRNSVFVNDDCRVVFVSYFVDKEIIITAGNMKKASHKSIQRLLSSSIPSKRTRNPFIRTISKDLSRTVWTLISTLVNPLLREFPSMNSI